MQNKWFLIEILVEQVNPPFFCLILQFIIYLVYDRSLMHLRKECSLQKRFRISWVLISTKHQEQLRLSIFWAHHEICVVGGRLNAFQVADPSTEKTLYKKIRRRRQSNSYGEVQFWTLWFCQFFSQILTLWSFRLSPQDSVSPFFDWRVTFKLGKHFLIPRWKMWHQKLWRKLILETYKYFLKGSSAFTNRKRQRNKNTMGSA